MAAGRREVVALLARRLARVGEREGGEDSHGEGEEAHGEEKRREAKRSEEKRREAKEYLELNPFRKLHH